MAQKKRNNNNIFSSYISSPIPKTQHILLIVIYKSHVENDSLFFLYLRGLHQKLKLCYNQLEPLLEFW